MKQRRCKRLLAILMCICMFAVLMPITVFAADLPEGPTVDGDVWTVKHMARLMEKISISVRGTIQRYSYWLVLQNTMEAIPNIIIWTGRRKQAGWEKNSQCPMKILSRILAILLHTNAKWTTWPLQQMRVLFYRDLHQVPVMFMGRHMIM